MDATAAAKKTNHAIGRGCFCDNESKKERAQQYKNSWHSHSNNKEHSWAVL